MFLFVFSETEKEIEDKPYSDRENEREGARGKPQRRSLQGKEHRAGRPQAASPSCSNTRPGGAAREVRV